MQAVHPVGRPITYRPISIRPSKAVYRRRRLAVLLCAASLVGVAWFGVQQLTGSFGDGPLTVAGQPVSNLKLENVARTRLIVQPGDTLWSLARRAQPSGDVRPLVDQLQKLRHGRMLQAGETIEIPSK